MFLKMGQALSNCTSASKNWREEKLVGCLDAIFDAPDNRWALDNIAGFLLFCTEEVSMVSSWNGEGHGKMVDRQFSLELSGDIYK